MTTTTLLPELVASPPHLLPVCDEPPHPLLPAAPRHGQRAHLRSARRQRARRHQSRLPQPLPRGRVPRRRARPVLLFVHAADRDETEPHTTSARRSASATRSTTTSRSSRPPATRRARPPTSGRRPAAVTCSPATRCSWATAGGAPRCSTPATARRTSAASSSSAGSSSTCSSVGGRGRRAGLRRDRPRRRTRPHRRGPGAHPRGLTPARSCSYYSGMNKISCPGEVHVALPPDAAIELFTPEGERGGSPAGTRVPRR